MVVRPLPRRARPRPPALAVGVLSTLLAGLAAAAGEEVPDTPKPQFSLGLERLVAAAATEPAPGAHLLKPGRLGLGLHPPEVTASGTPAAPGGRVKLRSAPPLALTFGAEPAATFRSFAAALVPASHNDGATDMDLLQRSATHEMDRARAHESPDGDAPAALLISIPQLVDAIARAVHNAHQRHAPEGSQVARGRTLEVLAREVEGGMPESVTVIPLVLGWVAPTAAGPCGADGACLVGGLPDAAFTGLVVGRGAAVVDVPADARVVAARLRPLGTLRVLPPHGAVGLQVRIVDGGSLLPVPVHPSVNAGRGEWLPLGEAGIAILAPAGKYVVEVRDDTGDTRHVEVNAAAESITEVTLSAP